LNVFFFELSSSRCSSDRTERFVEKNKGFAFANVSADHQITENVSAGVGVRNIFDKHRVVQ
jgi:outer membrane receptor for ferrienterochelin and colicin